TGHSTRQMDQGLKERLIGAAILVALAVWLIPWVLDGGPEPAPLATTLELPVPEQTAPIRTHTINLDAERSTPTSGAVAANPPARGAAGAAVEPRPESGATDEAPDSSAAATAAPTEEKSASAPISPAPETAAVARAVEGGGSRGSTA